MAWGVYKRCVIWQQDPKADLGQLTNASITNIDSSIWSVGFDYYKNGDLYQIDEGDDGSPEITRSYNCNLLTVIDDGIDDDDIMTWGGNRGRLPIHFFIHLFIFLFLWSTDG